jgi:glycerol uptake facilitator-like aquaporin
MSTTPADQPPLRRRLAAEAVGSFFLFATVVGSGIMAQSLLGGNDAVVLLANTLATGAILFVLITMLGPVSGAVLAALTAKLLFAEPPNPGFAR